MKNRQLMRLNLVSHKGQVKTIDCIAPGQVILLEDRTTEESFGGWVDLDEIEFIELTEEWLLKFGFRFDSIDWEFPNESIFFIGYYSSKFCLGSGSDGVTKENYIHYVHQLQNLYFALTGQELTIKN